MIDIKAPDSIFFFFSPFIIFKKILWPTAEAFVVVLPGEKCHLGVLLLEEDYWYHF